MTLVRTVIPVESLAGFVSKAKCDLAFYFRDGMAGFEPPLHTMLQKLIFLLLLLSWVVLESTHLSHSCPDPKGEWTCLQKRG